MEKGKIKFRVIVWENSEGREVAATFTRQQAEAASAHYKRKGMRVEIINAAQ